MSTVAEPKTRPEPKKTILLDPKAKYQRQILADKVPDEQTTIDAGCLLSDRDTDAATLANRRQWAKDIPAGKQEEADAEKMVVPTLSDVEARPLTDFQTIGELDCQLRLLEQARVPGFVGKEGEEKHRRQRDARSKWSSAIAELRKTASVDLHARLEAIDNEQAQLHNAIQARPQVAQLQAQITRLEAEAAELQRGKMRRAATYDGQAPPRTPEEFRNAYLIKRQEIAALKKKLSKAMEGERENKRDQSRIAKLEEERAAIHKRMLKPENMRWAADPDPKKKPR